MRNRAQDERPCLSLMGPVRSTIHRSISRDFARIFPFSKYVLIGYFTTQAEYLRQQAEWQVQAQQQAQFQQLQQLQAQQTSFLQPIAPQPTAFASNNPFGGPGASPSPSLSTVSAMTSMTTASSSNSSRMSPATPFSARSASSRPGTSLNDERHPQIAGLFAGRTGVPEDGVDTFGNVGQLRFGPADVARLSGAKTGASGGGGGPLQTQRTAVF